MSFRKLVGDFFLLYANHVLSLDGIVDIISLSTHIYSIIGA